MDWNTETVNIIYASNDGYAGHLAASLYSLLDHNRNIPRMDIYILSVGMSEAYLERLAGIAGKFCRSLHVAELGNLRERFDYAVDTRGFDISAMGRLFAPKVLPDSVRKALYLDCSAETDLLQQLTNLNNELYTTAQSMDQALENAPASEGGLASARYYRDVVYTLEYKASHLVNELEANTSAEYWPYPTYADILFSV